jgi:hypothetical protein
MLLVLGASEAWAQRGAYDIVVDSAPYASLTAPFSLQSFQPIGALSANAEGVAEVALPFEFPFYGNRYDTVYLYTNGVLSFERVATSDQMIRTLRPPSAVPAAGDDLDAYIAPLWDDFDFVLGQSELRTKVSGAPGNQVFSVEYFDFGEVGGILKGNFRVDLQEADGQIRVWYGQSIDILNATVAIEDELGLDGFNLLAPSASCSGNCPCFPASCSQLNVPSGRRITARLPAAADLLGEVLAPAGANPGDSVAVDIIIENQGLTDAGSLRWELYIGDDPSQLGTTLLDSGLIPSVVRTSSVTLRRTVTIPGSSPRSQRWLSLRIDVDQSVTEAREDNNDQLGVPFGTAPDLTGLFRLVPFETGPGTPMEFELRLESQGAPTTRSFEVDFYFSFDQQFDAGDDFLDRQSFQLPDGFVFDDRVSVVVPNTVPAGTQAFLLAVVDAPPQRVIELDESNNTVASAQPLSVRAADLQVNPFRVDGAVIEGLPFDLVVPLRNTTGSLAPAIDVCVFVTPAGNPGPAPTPADEVLRVRDIDLAPSAATELRLRPEAPVGQLGLRNIVVFVDCANEIQERDEVDNRRSGQATVVPPGPDFAPEIVDHVATVQAGRELPIRFRVRNLGPVTEPPLVQLRLVSDATEQVLAVPAVPPVAGESEITVDRSVLLPPTTPSGVYSLQLIATADGGNEVDPSNDTVTSGQPVRVEGFDVTLVATDPPPAIQGRPYVFAFQAIGGTDPSWSLTWTDQPPPGVTFTEGELTGSPSELGTFPFDVELTTAEATVGTSGVLAVLPPSVPLTIVDGALPPAVVGQSYREQVTVVGGQPPYVIEIDEIPGSSGFGAPGSDGTVAGVPAFPSAYIFEVTVTDSVGTTVSAPVALDVLNPASSISIALPALPDGLVDRPYEARVIVQGGEPPFSFVFTGELPTGLRFDEGTGVFSGTPREAGAFPVILEARDREGRFDRNPFVLEVIEAGSLQIATVSTDLPDARVGEAYIDPRGRVPVQLEVTGADPDRPVTWFVGSGELPEGLQLVDGVIEGTPSSPGVFAFTVGVADESGDFARRFYVIRVLDRGEEPGSTFVRDSGGCRATGGSPGWWMLAVLGLGRWSRRTARREEAR